VVGAHAGSTQVSPSHTDGEGQGPASPDETAASPLLASTKLASTKLASTKLASTKLASP
jgi:hypothetical protein